MERQLIFGRVLSLVGWDYIHFGNLALQLGVGSESEATGATGGGYESL